ncbi:hypothetical protein CDD81_3772 [Ophiocordyceps australis]|uniref:Eisosome protein 1 n=1 Tax=Ophiocordyceps australis TaxID=1399860 RepID=A0A2C5Y603_9HYPO|nr:hypothetical protein CDD81_3772 [Ophiocordyceps australis]
MAGVVAGPQTDPVAAPAPAAVDTAGAAPSKQAPSRPISTGRIKYADPRSLPSFPSSGLAGSGAAASAAASLGWSNKKVVEMWKPQGTSAASSAAAVLAKDYKMAPMWEPATNSHGHKAALLAVGSAGAALKQSGQSKPNTTPAPAPAPVSSTTAPSQEKWGNSAATQAFHAARPSAVTEPVDTAHAMPAVIHTLNVRRSLSAKRASTPASTPAPGDRPLLAAKGAMSQGRPSSLSAVGLANIQQAENSAAASALNGATRAHRASMMARVPGPGSGAVPVTTMTRNMFTSNPAFKNESENDQRLHQSAVDMAKRMFQLQQKMADQAKLEHGEDAPVVPLNSHLNLQDAAYRQAQERLAKLHDEHMQNREMQEYYGNVPTDNQRRRFSVASRLRRRSSWDEDEDADRKRSQKIHEQMSMFSSKLSQVDKEKRERDREALLAAAQRNVKARLHGMDQKIYQDTGRASPSVMNDWEVKAQKAAQLRHDTRSENRGKVDLGGGKFMDSAEVDAIAAKHVQPILQDIDQKVETQRTRRTMAKLDEETRREEAEKQKARDREFKDINKKTKDMDKQEEKARKAEEKRLARESKRKSKHDTSAGHEDGTAVAASTAEDAAQDEAPQPTVDTTADTADTAGAEASGTLAGAGTHRGKSEGATSPTSKVKGWIKNRFSRGKSMSEGGEKRRSFFGGAGMKEPNAANGSSTSLGNKPPSPPNKDSGAEAPDLGTESVAEAADREEPETEVLRDSRGVSPVSTPGEEAKKLGDGLDDGEVSPGGLEPPRRIEEGTGRASSSLPRDSRFLEMMDR